MQLSLKVKPAESEVVARKPSLTSNSHSKSL